MADVVGSGWFFLLWLHRHDFASVRPWNDNAFITLYYDLCVEIWEVLVYAQELQALSWHSIEILTNYRRCQFTRKERNSKHDKPKRPLEARSERNSKHEEQRDRSRLKIKVLRLGIRAAYNINNRSDQLRLTIGNLKFRLIKEARNQKTCGSKQKGPQTRNKGSRLKIRDLLFGSEHKEWVVCNSKILDTGCNLATNTVQKNAEENYYI